MTPRAPASEREAAPDMTDAVKLRVLAAWFDMWDERDDVRRRSILDDQNFPGKNDVQRDLRRIADQLDAAPAPFVHPDLGVSQMSKAWEPSEPRAALAAHPTPPPPLDARSREWWPDELMVNCGLPGDEGFVGDAATVEDARQIAERHNIDLRELALPAATPSPDAGHDEDCHNRTHIRLDDALDEIERLRATPSPDAGEPPVNDESGVASILHDNGFTWDDANAVDAILGHFGLIVALPAATPSPDAEPGEVSPAPSLSAAVPTDGEPRSVLARGVSDGTPSPDAGEPLDTLPRLWWCPAWGTLNETRYHGNDGPDDPNCGKVAYVRDSDLRMVYPNG